MSNSCCFQLVNCEDLWLFSVFLWEQMESVWGFGLLVGRTKQFEDVSLGYGKMQCVCPRAYVIKMSQNPRWHPQMSSFVHNPKIFSLFSQRTQETRNNWRIWAFNHPLIGYQYRWYFLFSSWQLLYFLNCCSTNCHLKNNCLYKV